MSESTQDTKFAGFLRSSDEDSQAFKDPYSVPLDEINLIRPDVVYNDTHLG